MTTKKCCCAECGKEEGDGGASLKACKSCMRVKYCHAECQRNHWATHKADCKIHAAELRDEALFKDPPPKEDCPICFLPMPTDIISCASLPPATISSLPKYDFAAANEELAKKSTEEYYPCCGKSICARCIHSFRESGNSDRCPFCNSERMGKTDEERVEEIIKRVAANDAVSICVLAGSYYRGLHGLQRDEERAMKLLTRAAELGFSKAHYNLGMFYHERGDLKKAKFHIEASAMAGDEAARCNLGSLECNSGKMERAVKHWTIAASAGEHCAMHYLRLVFEQGHAVGNQLTKL